MYERVEAITQVWERLVSPQMGQSTVISTYQGGDANESHKDAHVGSAQNAFSSSAHHEPLSFSLNKY